MIETQFKLITLSNSYAIIHKLLITDSWHFLDFLKDERCSYLTHPIIAFKTSKRNQKSYK